MISLWGGGGWGCLERMVTTELPGYARGRSSLYFEPRGSEVVEGDGRKGRCGVLERVTNKASEFGGRRCVPVEEGDQGGLVRCTLIAAGGDMLLLGDYFPLLYSCLFLWESFVGEGEEIDRLTMEHPSFTCGGGFSCG